jgi:hypothetical protein
MAFIKSLGCECSGCGSQYLLPAGGVACGDRWIDDMSASGTTCGYMEFQLVGCIPPGSCFNIIGSEGTDYPLGLNSISATGLVSWTPTQLWNAPIQILIFECADPYNQDIAEIALSITGADACFCGLDLDTSGGDECYDRTFDVTDDFISARYITIDFESYTIKDQLLIDADGVNIYDSGCVGAHINTSVLVPAGTTSARVRVVCNCEGTTGTLWTLNITCA